MRRSQSGQAGAKSQQVRRGKRTKSTSFGTHKLAGFTVITEEMPR
jgi:hypothetical protein